MKTLTELLLDEKDGLTPLKMKINPQTELSVPQKCSCYGMYLAKDKLPPPFNDIDTQGIHIVVHDPKEKITCYPIRRDGGEKIYAVSFDFSGCFMALFEQDGILYAAHITTSSDGSVDGRNAFKEIIRKEGTSNYIVYKPSEGMGDHTAGIVEFTDFDHFQCYSFGQNFHRLETKEVRKNDTGVLEESASQGKQGGGGCVIL